MTECKYIKMKDLMFHVYQFEKHLSRDHKMLLNEALVLGMLGNGKPRRSTDLADELGTTYSMMSRTLSSLEDAGFVERAIGKEDKREMLFTITKTGAKKLSVLNGGYDFDAFFVALNK